MTVEAVIVCQNPMEAKVGERLEFLAFCSIAGQRIYNVQAQAPSERRQLARFLLQTLDCQSAICERDE